LDTATKDYNYLNDMLKSELPRFFALKSSFIQPVFEHLFNMQARIYGMIYARCYELLQQNLDVFQTNTMGIEQGFTARRQQCDARSEMENMDLLKSGGKAWLAASGGANNSKLSLQERAAIKAAEANASPTFDPYYNNQPAAAGAIAPPPAYGVTVNSTPYGSKQQQYVVALYDYTAQAEGDLSFKKDDRIEIVQKTADTNDWWTGRLNGMTGVFPFKKKKKKKNDLDVISS
jgi:amphiphysin